MGLTIKATILLSFDKIDVQEDPMQSVTDPAGEGCMIGQRIGRSFNWAGEGSTGQRFGPPEEYAKTLKEDLGASV